MNDVGIESSEIGTSGASGSSDSEPSLKWETEKKEEIILETEGGPAFHIRWHEDGKYFTVTRGAMTLLQIGEKIAALMGKAFLSKRDNLIVLTRKKHEKLMKQVRKSYQRFLEGQRENAEQKMGEYEEAIQDREETIQEKEQIIQEKEEKIREKEEKIQELQEKIEKTQKSQKPGVFHILPVPVAGNRRRAGKRG